MTNIAKTRIAVIICTVSAWLIVLTPAIVWSLWSDPVAACVSGIGTVYAAALMARQAWLMVRAL